jgi:hypothetical protein
MVVGTQPNILWREALSLPNKVLSCIVGVIDFAKELMGSRVFKAKKPCGVAPNKIALMTSCMVNAR